MRASALRAVAVAVTFWRGTAHIGPGKGGQFGADDFGTQSDSLVSGSVGDDSPVTTRSVTTRRSRPPRSDYS